MLTVAPLKTLGPETPGETLSKEPFWLYLSFRGTDQAYRECTGTRYGFYKVVGLWFLFRALKISDATSPGTKAEIRANGGRPRLLHEAADGRACYSRIIQVSTRSVLIPLNTT